MKNRKRSIILLLIVFSMVLLIALQFFWIYNSYEKAFDGLRRDANLLFRTSAMSMRNATWMRAIEQVSNDSTKGGVRLTFSRYDNIESVESDNTIRKKVDVFLTRELDTAALFSETRIVSDSLVNDTTSVDTLQFVRRPPSVIFNIQSDTLNTDTLKSLYKKALAQAGILSDFLVTHRRDTIQDEFIRKRRPSDPPFFGREEEFALRHPRRTESAGDTIQSYFRTGPFSEYSVKVFNFQPILLRQIAPQLFFSIFLTLMIGGAFLMMYRNVRSQELLMKSKNEFIGNISHELKTPVATVSVALEALKNFNAIDNPTLTREYLEIAQAELNRLSILTDKILKTAVFEDGGVDYQPEQVNLDDTIQQVIGSMKLVFEKEKAIVCYEKSGQDFSLSGSPTHLTNVIYNLVDNALKYSPGSPEISISLSSSVDKFLLVVKDNGIGIEPSYHKKIFEKFFRVPTGDVHDIKGYGLGLNYVESVIHRHHGSIHLTSTPGKGSEFSVILPRSRRS